MIVAIDADPIVYRCGFAAEKTSWHLVYETATGETDEIEFSADDKGTAGGYMREWLDFQGTAITVLDKQRVIHPDPVSYALRATKVQIESIISECEHHYKQPSKMLMWISGKGGSYRDRIATVRPYKGNRDPTHKPYHYDAIRDYLRTQYGSYITSGIEADDAVSIFAHHHYSIGGGSLVVATIDKDLDQIPGNHYNYMNKVFYAITESEAERFFVYQCLAGDITDNIVGVWKCGDKAANGILDSLSNSDFERRNSANYRAAAARHAVVEPVESAVCPRLHAADAEHGGDSGSSASGSHDDGSDIRQYAGISGSPLGDRQSSESSGAAEGISNTAEGRRPDRDSVSTNTSTAPRHAPRWWPSVVRAYANSQHKPACPYAENNPEAIAIEMAQLVKLQEYPGQLWHPHGDLVVPGFGEENFDGP